jgi:integrase
MTERDALERTPEGHKVRLRYGKGLRARFLIRTLDEDVAERRAVRLRELAAMLARCGHSAHAFTILTEAAGAQSERDFAGYCKVGEDLCGAGAKAPKPRSTMTLEQLGEKWTGGELARDYPDQIRKKRTADDDESRLKKHVYPVIGGIAVTSITLDDAERVMRSLDPELSPLTRRNIGQTIVRLMNMAVYPLRLIPSTPIPAGFLPKPTEKKARAVLYPDEDRRLLASGKVPLCYRLLWGFFMREGAREGEVLGFTVGDFDLVRGAVRLDKNKTDDPRAWALSPGVAVALTRYLERYRPDAEPGELMFQDEHGRPLTATSLAVTLRAHLEAIGLKKARPELFEATKERLRCRVHDLRGVFCTVSLANGKTESWITDRTGWQSSAMIATYKRMARTFTELDLGPLDPLDEAIPELRETAAEPAANDASEGGPELGQNLRRGSDSNRRVTVLQTVA